MPTKLPATLALLLIACGRGDSRSTALLPPTAPTPTEYLAGEQLFENNCQRCHGERGAGTNQGPTFLHQIYASNHHSDASFYRAAAMGATAHHWRFGNMPPVPGVSQDEVRQIINYVRWLQREVGIL